MMPQMLMSKPDKTTTDIHRWAKLQNTSLFQLEPLGCREMLVERPLALFPWLNPLY